MKDETFKKIIRLITLIIILLIIFYSFKIEITRLLKITLLFITFNLSTSIIILLLIIIIILLILLIKKKQ